MNWSLVGLLSSLGLLMAALSTRGLTRGIEQYLWIILALFATLVLARNLGQRHFTHGLLVGIAWGLTNCLVQVAFFEVYARNNPDLAKQFAAAPQNPRLMFLMMGPLIGLVTGLVLGSMGWLAHKAIPPSTTQSASQSTPTV